MSTLANLPAGNNKEGNRNKTHQTGNLYQLLNVESLRVAFKATAGVDKITAEEYAKELETNLGPSWTEPLLRVDFLSVGTVLDLHSKGES